jgi:hypothetical protein
LAPYLQGRPHLTDLCRTYGRLQQLYHSQLQQQLQQWGGAVGSKQISTVREYIKVVKRLVSERAGGWSINLGFLKVSTGATVDQLTEQGELLAGKLEQLVNSGCLPDRLDALVLPDLVTLITNGGSAAAGSFRDVSAPGLPPSDTVAAEQMLLQALVTLGMPAGQAPHLADHPEQLPLLPANKEQANRAAAV